MHLGALKLMHPNHDTLSVRSDVDVDSVRVYCRVRPQQMNESSSSENPPSCVYFNDNDAGNDAITWSGLSGNTEGTSSRTLRSKFIGSRNSNAESNVQYSFDFSGVFTPTSSQKEVYKNVAQPLIADVIQGYNGTIFVYGQTGSGKTYTMFGKAAPSGAIFCGSDTTDNNVAAVGADFGLKRGECLLNQGECPDSREGANRFISEKLEDPIKIEMNLPLDSLSHSYQCMPTINQDDQNPLGCSPSVRSEKETVHGEPSTAPSTARPSYLEARGTLRKSSQHPRQGPELGDATGIVHRAVNDLFHFITHADAGVEFEVNLFLVEIYMEQVIDLLAPTSSGQVSTPRQPQGHPLVSRSLQVREDANSGSFYVEGCEMPRVASVQETLSLIQAGMRRRTTSATNMNDVSSRSHCLLSFIVKRFDRASNEIKVGKLFLVDLAGSEKVSRTKSEGLGLEEAKLINKSLLTLSLVIQALTENATHVPYRNSVLTKLLKDSLGGNFRTALVVCCSPALCNAEETLSSLRFGARAKNIQNHAVINRELIAEELRRMLKSAQEEIKMLHAKLRQQRRGCQEVRDSCRIRRTTVMETASARGVGEKSNSKQQIRGLLSGQGSPPGEGDNPFLDYRRNTLLDDDEDNDSSRASNGQCLIGQARMQMYPGEMQIELNEARDTLRGTQEVNVALREQVELQIAKVAILEEENMIWEQEYEELRQCFTEQERLLATTKSQVSMLCCELGTLTAQLTKNLDSVRRARELLDRSEAHAYARSKHRSVIDPLEGSQVDVAREMNSDSRASPFKSPSLNCLSSPPMMTGGDANMSPDPSVDPLLDGYDKNVENGESSALVSPHMSLSLTNMIARPLLATRENRFLKQPHSKEGEGQSGQSLLQVSSEIASFTLELLDELGVPFRTVLAHQLSLEGFKPAQRHLQASLALSTVPSLDGEQRDPAFTLGDTENHDTGNHDTDTAQQKSDPTYARSQLLNEAVLCILELGKKIQEMHQNLAKEAHSRNSAELKLQLAERKLKIRQERIEALNLGIQQEIKSSQELRAIMEKDRNRHTSLVHVARKDANFWRRRFEELDEHLQRPHKQQKV